MSITSKEQRKALEAKGYRIQHDYPDHELWFGDGIAFHWHSGWEQPRLYHPEEKTIRIEKALEVASILGLIPSSSVGGVAQVLKEMKRANERWPYGSMFSNIERWIEMLEPTPAKEQEVQ